jgi:hypothetical protein
VVYLRRRFRGMDGSHHSRRLLNIRGAEKEPVLHASHPMRFIHLYLIGYCLLVLGVGLALWQTGVLERIAPIWIGIGALVAVGLGIMLSVRSGKPTVTEDLER